MALITQRNNCVESCRSLPPSLLQSPIHLPFLTHPAARALSLFPQLANLHLSLGPCTSCSLYALLQIFSHPVDFAI